MKKNRKILYPIIALGFISLTFTACSNDDDSEPGVGGGASMPSIPSSVVDGVRVTEMGGVSVSYNTDGSINEATADGITYKFEYAGSRAEGTTRQLSRIYATGYDDEKITATNFAFNTDGFVVRWYEERVDQGEDYMEKVSINYTIDYSAKGRIQTMNFSGKMEGYDEDGRYSETGKGAVKYSYTAEQLTSSVYEDAEAKSSISFSYNSTAPTNTYNIVTTHLAGGMSHITEIAKIFAYAGYLGNSSSVLPTGMSYTYVDKEDDYSESDTYSISYTTNSAGRVTAVTTTNEEGYSTTEHIGYKAQ